MFSHEFKIMTIHTVSEDLENLPKRIQVDKHKCDHLKKRNKKK